MTLPLLSPSVTHYDPMNLYDTASAIYRSPTDVRTHTPHEVVLGLSATRITPPIMLHANIKCIISLLHPGRKHPEIGNLLRGHTSDNTHSHTLL